jgi:uncharacterized membrane protein YsdA (DUF1294 family)
MGTFLLLSYYKYINIIGFLLSGIDKLISINHLFKINRISERTLLVLAALGAFPGETIAFIAFSHKTRKGTLDFFV